MTHWEGLINKHPWKTTSGDFNTTIYFHNINILYNCVYTYIKAKLSVPTRD